VVPVDEKLKRYYMKVDAAADGASTYYPTSTTRGCPASCTYCGNNAFRQLGGREGYCRKFPLDWVINDLEEGIRVYLPHRIVFNDECLICKSPSELKEFCERFHRMIGLPFRGMATPPSVTKHKLEQLVAAGMREIQVGVQSGSFATLEMYRRQWARPERVIAASKILSQYTPPLRVTYDIILDNPYESRDDILQTARLIQDLDRPARFQIFSLTPYPGTELARRMEEDGLLSRGALERMAERSYQQKNPVYPNVLCSIAARRPPRWLFRLLASRAAFALLDRWWLAMAYSSVYEIAYWLRRQTKEIRRRSGRR
jgi:radical SAM superfamily enzyme YgiQ (UPF0313 family)